ncbi:MAG: hypothetical protein FK734_04800 [Asgard group archaeon]|nr:hypothetical protein [Asgard group archaeon]
MCHLVGFISNENVVPTILESLWIQEPIIGAQATGIAVIQNEKVKMIKDIGSVKNFESTHDLEDLKANIGIGHTRYALKNLDYAETNTIEKAHPFWNSTKEYVTMHNGTISNYLDFVQQLEDKGYKFRSKSEYQKKDSEELETDFCDSEIFSFILEEELKKGIDIKQAIKNACKDIRGHFAFVVLHPNYPNQIFVANWMQPIFVGYSKKSAFFCSFEIGFQPEEDNLPWKFEPTKNTLITLKAGEITVEPLVEDRMIPNYKPTYEIFKKAIINGLKEEQNDLGRLMSYFIVNPGMIGLTREKFEQISTVGGMTFTPYIYAFIEMMEKEGLINRKLVNVWEGGITDIPRYKFYLKYL